MCMLLGDSSCCVLLFIFYTVVPLDLSVFSVAPCVSDKGSTCGSVTDGIVIRKHLCHPKLCTCNSHVSAYDVVRFGQFVSA